MAQPKMGLVRNLLGRTLYPDNEWTRDRDGSPLRPYDTATHTMAEVMGVRVDPSEDAVTGEFERLQAAIPITGTVGSGTAFVLDGRENQSFRAVNLLLDKGVKVRRVDEGTSSLRAGDFLVTFGSRTDFEDVARTTGVDFASLGSEPARGVHDVKRMRVGMYQRYRGGNMDEGWTRFVLEQFGFPYRSVLDAEIQKGSLNQTYDVIVLPHDSKADITGEKRPPQPGRPPEVYPPEYVSGIGDEGLESLKAFVEGGGTLVTFGEASELAIDLFALPVRNVLDKVDSKSFFCPGSTLRVRFDDRNPLAYGMPDEGLVLFWESPAFEISPTRHNDRYETVVTYKERDLLESGWLVGEEHLSKKAGMVSAEVGQGRVVLIGFRTQHRAQTHGTFKLLFNAMLR
jgi:hypothetical protein